jgi:thymidine phosphorylase
LLTLHTDEAAIFTRAVEALEGGYSIGSKDAPINRLPLVIERIEG